MKPSRQILLFEEHPLIAVAVREIVSELLPSGVIKIAMDLHEPHEGEFDFVILVLEGQLARQYDIINQFSNWESKRPVLILTTLPPKHFESFKELLGDIQFKVLTLSMSFKEIATEIKQFIDCDSNGSFVQERKNDFQSNIQSLGSDKPLTHQQVRIMELCIQGLTGKEIARQLGLSPETVRAHIRSAYIRLNASSRSEAIKNYVDAKRQSGWFAEAWHD